jgi:membrane protease YdiL (CAAX protease family)
LLAAMAYGLGASLALGHLNPSLKTLWAIPESPLAIMAALMLVVILAPLSEELLFRGWLYTALRWRLGFRASLWATALIFSLAHWESTHLYALAILPIGLVLGHVRERTGSVRATTLFHMIYNSSGLALTFLGKA